MNNSMYTCRKRVPKNTRLFIRRAEPIAGDGRLGADAPAGVDVEVDVFLEAGSEEPPRRLASFPFYSCSVEVSGEGFSCSSGIVDSDDRVSVGRLFPVACSYWSHIADS